MKRVLVTGAGGMLGRALVSALHDFEVVGLGRRPSCGLTIPYRACDLGHRAQAYDTIRFFRPDAVIHAAAMTDVDGCEKDPKEAFRVNRDGTRHVVEALEDKNTLLVFLSTDYVFDGRKKGPYDESDAPCPLNVYGRSKWEAEACVRARCGRSVIVRTSWLFGPHGKNFVDSILRLAEKRKVLQVVADQKGRPTYAPDLAQALRALIVSWDRKGGCAAGLLHVANRGEINWFGFAREILSLNGRKCRLESVTSEKLGRPARRPANSVLSTELFDRIVGSPLRGWREALRDYLKIRAIQEVRT